MIDGAVPGATEWGQAIGVGPWEGDWPTDQRYDPEPLKQGDRRNVVDRYRYWRREAVVADLDARRHPFHVAIENFGHDHNIGTVVRTANAVAAPTTAPGSPPATRSPAGEVPFGGRRGGTGRGAMVTDRYQHLRHH